MKDPHHNRSTGRGRIVVMAVLIILVGAGIMLYPKVTDLRYMWSQWRMAAGAVAAQAATWVEGTESSGSTSCARGIALPDEAVALLEIPAIDFQAYVLEGTDGSALAKGPGHYLGTPLPGEAGNSVLAGHRTMYGHPFHDLDLLQTGDEILTGTADCTAVYRVARVVVVYPSQMEVVAQTGADLLTLTTCHPKGSATRRLVVVAERTG